MDRKAMVAGLAASKDVPFGREALERMTPKTLAGVANEAGLEPDDVQRFAANRPPESGLSFQAKSTLGCGPGDASRFEEDRYQDDAQNEGGDGVGFTVRSTLGAGPGDSSRFDR